MDADETVSFDGELLIVVDKHDTIIDYKSKIDCHQGDGILHRAFSIFIFNDDGQLILQKRSNKKWLWPHYWSNSCCSHPRKGEKVEEAAYRRLKEELGIESPLTFLFKFQYSVPYKNVGSEREMCSVLIGKSNSHISPNKNEIDEWKYMDIEKLDENMSVNPDKYTPWFKLEWERIKKDHWQEIENL